MKRKTHLRKKKVNVKKEGESLKRGGEQEYVYECEGKSNRISGRNRASEDEAERKEWCFVFGLVLLSIASSSSLKMAGGSGRQSFPALNSTLVLRSTRRVLLPVVIPIKSAYYIKWSGGKQFLLKSLSRDLYNVYIHWKGWQFFALHITFSALF